MSAGEIIAVLDAGPLIHLDELGSLNLLAGYREVLLPEIVEQEARKHRPEIPIDSIPGLVRVSSNPVAAESMFELAAEFGLHAGELAAIAVLKEHHGDCLLSDDAAARELARAILAERLLPTAAASDAIHAIVAAQNRVNILLTWNCRHLANPHLLAKLRAFMATRELVLPEICTPIEIVGE